MLALPCTLTLPETFTGSLRLTPDQFAELCAANPDAVLELATDGSLISMNPAVATRLPATAPSHCCFSCRAGGPDAVAGPGNGAVSPGDEGPRGLTAVRRKMAAYGPMTPAWAGC